MNKQSRILILEDNPADAELMQRQLRKAGFDFTAELAQDKKAFLQALEKFIPNIILADYSLPEFDGVSAIRLARKRYPEIPGIIVSGAIGEETAIEALKAGATDYVLKDRLKRLGPVVQRALEEHEGLSEKRRVEQALQKSHAELSASEAKFRALIENSADMIVIAEASGAVRYISPNVVKMLGYLPREIEGRDGFSFAHPDDKERCRKFLEETIRKPRSVHRIEARGRSKDGSWHWLHIVSQNLLADPAVAGIIINIRDITERKQAEDTLRASNEELNRFNRAMVGRELQMVELKKEVNELCRRAGLPKRYR